VIEVPDGIVMPGLIDTHRHLWQTPIRGLGADLTAPEYRATLRAAFGPFMTPEDVYTATLAGALEALDGGITTIVDWAHIMNSPEHADASVAALRATGMRCVFAFSTPNDREADSWYSRSTRPHPDDVKRVRSEVLGDDEALVTMAFGARAPHLLSREIMIHDWNLARELGLRITVDGGLGGGQWGPRHYPIRLLRDAGLMRDDTTYIHCNNLAEDEYQSIAETGGSISMSPCAEMHVGHGLPATGRALSVGIRPALSIDYVTQVAGDLFGTMRSVLATERGIRSRAAFEAGRGVAPWTIRTGDVFEFATLRGAAALGYPERTGSLEAGKQADIAILDTAKLRLSPVNDPLATCVLYAGPADVDTVIVAGKLRKRGGALIGHDVATLRGELIALRDRLFERGAAMNRKADGYAVYSW
jgi:cytosine/adenosine deaminase-related metal-dependent hydrolase